MEAKLSKLITSKNIIKQHMGTLICPKCKEQLNLIENSLLCENKHSFDLSKKGYVNFAQGNSYDKDLFDVRRKVFENGFFMPLSLSLAEIIKGFDFENLQVLDAGCGEGSQLAAIKSIIDEADHPDKFLFSGIDITKEAVALATSYSNILWLVGDLSNLPFCSSSVNVILNILSPANYSEFNRVLKPDGIVIKVIPREDYLKELRVFFNKSVDYSDKEVTQHFSKNLKLLKEFDVGYKVHTGYLEQIVNMTPLSWKVSEELKQNLLDSGLNEVTASFHIIIGTGENKND